MADTLEWKLIDPVAAKEAWALEHGSRCMGVEIYLNGQEIVSLLREIELPYATQEGKLHLAGDYGHNAPQHLYKMLTEETEVELLCCGGCGDSGCWSVVVTVREEEDYVYWEHFAHNHRDWEYPLSYCFDRQEYEQALQQLRGFTATAERVCAESTCTESVSAEENAQIQESNMVYEIEDTRRVASLFEEVEDSLVTSCLQKVMGKIYADDLIHPTSAVAILGDFCFFAGKPDKALVQYKPDWCEQDFIIMVPPNEEWAALIEECYGAKAKRVTRYAIRKEQGIFDREHLQKVVNSLPEGYTLTMMDEKLFYHCKETVWCRDWVAQFPDYTLYARYGLGALVLKDGEPVSGASSYSGYEGGIEIEIKTLEDYRRRGLAYVCGAKLILECLERGLYPNWDAQNKWSVGLAEKLGYHFSHEYPAYEIWGY